MGYGRYGSGSYSSYGGSGGGSYTTYGNYTSRSSARSASVSRTSTTENSVNSAQQSVAQEPVQKISEQKTVKKATFRNSPTPDKPNGQKTVQTSSEQKSAMKKGSKHKSSSHKVSEQTTSVQKTSCLKKTTEHNTSTQKASPKQTNVSQAIVHVSSEEQETVEGSQQDTGIIVFTEGTFLVKKDPVTIVETSVEKTADELKLEKEELRKVIKKKDLHDMELQVTKHPKFLALQDKLNARLSKRNDVNKKSNKHGNQSESKIKPPTGYVTYGLVTIKNIASFLELSLSNEEATLKTLEDIHDLLDKEFVSHNVYKVEAEIGKFLLVTKSAEEMLNLSMKIQIKFNEHRWDDMIMTLPMFRKLLRPEDLLNDDAVPLFNGPRLSIGVHSGEASTEEDSAGHPRYCGLNIIQVEAIGKFAQGGQILISSNAWTKVKQSELSKHAMERLGVFKLDDFDTGCSLVEITPEVLKERAKFYGAICSYCAKGIQPWDQSFEKLQSTWHVGHFKCFKCNAAVGEGSYAAYQGLPYCHSCYLTINPKPKCKKCSNPIAKEYINALGHYWHANCFSCKDCRKRPIAESPLYGHKDDPYCHTCYEKIVNV